MAQEKSRAKKRTITGIVLVCAGFVLCFAGVIAGAAAKKVTGVTIGFIVVGIITLLVGLSIAVLAARSGPVVSIEGKILDRATNRRITGTSDVYQDFFLVEDTHTNKKYPVYVDRKVTFSTLSLRPRRFLHEEFEVGDSVSITGRIQSTVCKSPEGRKILGESDMDSTDTGLLAWAEFLVP